MKKYIFILGFLFLSLFNLEAKYLKFNIDGAMFRTEDNKARWEMYYTFPETMLRYSLKVCKIYRRTYIFPLK